MSSGTGRDSVWRVKVVVVLPVPDRPTIRAVLSPSGVGITFAPACMASAPCR